MLTPIEESLNEFLETTDQEVCMHREFGKYGSAAIKLIEECSEVQKVCCKIERFGLDDYNPLTYLQGVNRYNCHGSGIFQNIHWDLTYLYTFNRYPMLSSELRPDGLIKTGMQALSWYVWTKRKPNYPHREPICRWLDIDRYVLRKGKTA